MKWSGTIIFREFSKMFFSFSTMIGSVLHIKGLDFKWAQTQIHGQLLYFFFSFGRGKYFMNRERSILYGSELYHAIGMEVGVGRGASFCVGMEVGGWVQSVGGGSVCVRVGLRSRGRAYFTTCSYIWKFLYLGNGLEQVLVLWCLN